MPHCLPVMSCSIRQDVHSPTNLDPADYRFEDAFDKQQPKHPIKWERGMDGVMYVRGVNTDVLTHSARVRELLEEEGWQEGNYQEKGTCDHCGARMRYAVVYRHLPTNELIVTGEICASERMSLGTKHEWEVKRLRSEAKKIKERNERIERLNEFVENDRHCEIISGLNKALDEEHNNFYRSLIDYFEDNGELTEKQLDAAESSLEKRQEMHEKAEEESGEWVAKEGERLDFTVTIDMIKRVESRFGVSWLHKMTTESGDELTWFGTGRSAEQMEEGETWEVRATIKEHQTWRGYKQNLVNRVSPQNQLKLS